MSSKRSLGLDLARAIAIALVLFCHVAMIETTWLKQPPVWQFAACGRFGVQLFFVLSGFLIGRILIGLVTPAVDDAWSSLRNWRIFMARRWLRTLPLYWVVLVLLVLAWPPLFWLPYKDRHLASHFFAYATMTQNLTGPMPDGWFNVSWSLAVEEWFYLVFSALLLGLAKMGQPARALALTLIPFLLIPPALRWLLSETDWLHRHGLIVPLWFDGLAIGVVAARVWPSIRLRQHTPWALLAAGLLLVAIVWSGSAQPGSPPWRSLKMDVLSIGFALCLPALMRVRSLPHWLALPTVNLSRWSYCLYLVHLPLLEMGGYYSRNWFLRPLLTGALCMLTAFLLAALSWRYLEEPILARRPAQ